MMLLVNILWILFIFLLVLLLSVFFIPFEYTFSGEKYETSSLKGKISWFFGGLQGSITMASSNSTSFALQIFGFRLSPQVQREEKLKAKKTKDAPIKDKKKKASKIDARLFLDKKLFETLCQFAIDVLKHMKPQVFLLHGSIGFDDPYHTGIFWGGLNILYPFLKDFDIQVVPVFHEEKFEGNFAVEGRLILGALLLLAIKVLLSKPGRNIIKQLIINKKEEKSYVI